MVPDVDELTRIADLIEPARFKALILNSAWCCLRYDEVTELRPKDIGEGAEVIGGLRRLCDSELPAGLAAFPSSRDRRDGVGHLVVAGHSAPWCPRTT